MNAPEYELQVISKPVEAQQKVILVWLGHTHTYYFLASKSQK